MLRFSQTQVSDFLWFNLLGLRRNLVGEELMFLSTDVARSHVRAEAFGFFEQIRNRPPFLRAWTRHRVQEVWDFFVYRSNGACDLILEMGTCLSWIDWWNDWRYWWIVDEMIDVMSCAMLALCIMAMLAVIYYCLVGCYLLWPCWPSKYSSSCHRVGRATQPGFFSRVSQEEIPWRSSPGLDGMFIFDWGLPGPQVLNASLFIR